MAKDIETWEDHPEKSIIKQKEGKTMLASIIDHFKDLIISGDMKGIKELLSEYWIYCHENQTMLLFFLDEYKQFEKLRTENSFLFNEICYLKYSFHVKVFGRSDTLNLATSPLDPEIILTSKFNVAEAAKYLSSKLPQPYKVKLPPYDPLSLVNTINETEYPDFKKLSDITEFLPYELEVFTQVAQNPNLAFDEIFEEFYLIRDREINEMHDEWRVNSFIFGGTKAIYKNESRH